MSANMFPGMASNGRYMQEVWAKDVQKKEQLYTAPAHTHERIPPVDEGVYKKFMAMKPKGF